jgi:hypothetical protein
MIGDTAELGEDAFGGEADGVHRCLHVVGVVDAVR